MPPVVHALPPAGRYRLVGSLAVTVAFLASPPVAGAEDPAEPAGEAARIDRLIDQLGSSQFAQREAATHGLVEAGRAAIGPLREALARDDLEVSSRVIEIVRGFLASDDPDLAADAESFLETAAEGPNRSVSRLAEDTLDFHMLGMAEAARERLESLGAVVAEGFLPTGKRGLQIVLNSSWRGGTEDLRLLTRLRGVVQIGVHGVPLDRASLAVLGRLRTIERLELYGTGAADEDVAALGKKLPEARLDVRKGGKLGVGGQPTIGPCLITHVQEGSAASKAGVQIGDIVLEIDGEPVANFEDLTGKVARHGPGDAVQLEIERGLPGGHERITRTIHLDGW
ncbi:MAG: PDZ domain-containing protein [Planctomycetia bacterium]|nr:PDZ domain-containing protein [Planctomycetia bacterium]